MDEYSFFELAGYTKEESIILEQLCIKGGIDFHVLLRALNNLKTPQQSMEMLISSIDTSEPKEMRVVKNYDFEPKKKKKGKQEENYFNILLKKYGRNN